nr:MAG TPA: hypothetical protein [Herelleviridae sp.]DAY53655.1 MAG TPA: hypothetical protein [Caudoviricetes sp.]
MTLSMSHPPFELFIVCFSGFYKFLPTPPWELC